MTEHKHPAHKPGEGRQLMQLLRTVLSGRVPGQAVIQFTDRCNALCAQCSMRASGKRARTTMSLPDVKRLLDDMANAGVRSVSFTGGEPLLHLEAVAEAARYASSIGIPYVRTGTNGFLFRGHRRPGFKDKIAGLARTLKDAGIRNFWISLDSSDPELHEKNRGLPGVVEGIRTALPIMHEHGLFPAANLGVNRLTGGRMPELQPSNPRYFNPDSFHGAFCRALRRFYDFAEELGFTMVNACYPMSHDSSAVPDEAVYAATSSDSMIHFSAVEKLEIFRAMYRVIPEARPRMRVFTPRSSLLALIRQYRGDLSVPACRGGIDFFFIDCNGMNTFPCGYRGEDNLGPFASAVRNACGTKPDCIRCDWECFRDPSTLFDPLTSLGKEPLSTMKRMFFKDREFTSAWLEDLAYYRSCGWFDGRTAPDKARLARHTPGHGGSTFPARLFPPVKA